MNLKTKVTSGVCGVVLLVMAILAVIGYQYLEREIKVGVSNQHAALLAIVAEQLDDRIEHSKSSLAEIAKGIRPEWLADFPAIQAYLDAKYDDRLLFDGGFLVLDAHGVVIAESPDSGHTRESRMNRDWARQAFASGKPGISAPYQSSVPPHHPIVVFTMPIFRRDGTVAAILGGRQDLTETNYLADLAKVKIGRTGYLYLVDSDRQVVVHPDKNRIMEKIPPGKNVGLDRAVQGFEGTLENTNSRGVAGLTSFKRLKEANWIVGSHFPLNEAYAPLRRARGFFLGAIAMVVLVTLALVWFLMRRLTAPLEWLTEHVRTLPDKQGTERIIDLPTGDELQSLAEAFNGMVQAMDQQRRDIEKSHELYRIVAEFTVELVMLRNPDGSVRYVSPNCLAITGYEEKEFYDNPRLIDTIVNPADQGLWLDHLLHVVGKKVSCQQFDLRIVKKDGSQCWLNHSCHPVMSSLGEYLGTRGSFRDVTRRVVLQHKLDEERRFAESLLDNTSTPLFVIDRHHKVIFWNRACEELTGIPATEMLGTDNQWQPFYPARRPTLCDLVVDGNIDRLGDFYGAFTSSVHLPGIVRAEGWLHNVNGQDRYLSFDAAPVFNREGERVAAVESLNDLTERKHVEERLNLFLQAVEQSASTIVITDSSGTIQYVNRKFCEVTGYTIEEVLGRKPNILKSGEQPPEFYTELWQTITAGREWHGEFQNKRKDGTLFWEIVTISPIIDQQGTTRHYLAVKEDITARKAAEREIRKKQAELTVKHEQLTDLYHQVSQGKREWEETLDCIKDMVILADPMGIIKRCNRPVVDFTGKEYRELWKCSWWEVILTSDMDVTHLQGQKGELYHRPTGRWFYLTSYGVGLEESGNSVVTLHDVTEVKKVSDELTKAYDELKTTHVQLLQQEKMASIGQLAAGVAHEINNPMGFISSNLGTMGKYLDRLEGFLTAEGEAVAGCASPETRAELAETRKRLKVDYVLKDARDLLAESADGAERVRRIVQNLKSFSRLDEAELKEADINECLESTINIAWNELKYKTTLVKEYGELPLVRCYPQQLNQVFLNILVNAAHAIETHGDITVRSWQEGEDVCVAISDTGSGIPEEVKNRIFEPFFTTKEVGKGTGLGLSISYDIIKKHDGSIEVSSEVGKGTTFTIRLPIIQEQTHG